jgi:hypothetical protein
MPVSGSDVLANGGKPPIQQKSWMTSVIWKLSREQPHEPAGNQPQGQNCDERSRNETEQERRNKGMGYAIEAVPLRKGGTWTGKGVQGSGRGPLEILSWQSRNANRSSRCFRIGLNQHPPGL